MMMNSNTFSLSDQQQTQLFSRCLDKIRPEENYTEGPLRAQHTFHAQETIYSAVEWNIHKQTSWLGVGGH